MIIASLCCNSNPWTRFPCPVVEAATFRCGLGEAPTNGIMSGQATHVRQPRSKSTVTAELHLHFSIRALLLIVRSSPMIHHDYVCVGCSRLPCALNRQRPDPVDAKLPRELCRTHASPQLTMRRYHQHTCCRRPEANGATGPGSWNLDIFVNWSP